tara:strand:- start:5770 stop:6411 length:642 start_codon:yes stop_codon:yes gene_type:complete
MSIQTLNSLLSPPTTNSANTQIQNTPSSENIDTTAIVGDTVNKESDIKLSSRAQKIQMLNEEFFPGGPSSVTITSEFIQRLHEYGFISESEANDLGSNSAATENESSGTLGALSAEIKSISKRLDSDSDLTDILSRADAIINNLDGSNPSSLTNNIKLVDAELNAYLGRADAEQLTASEKNSMDNLSLVLTIADKLNPNNLTSQKLNSYLSFM